jgi:Homeodomain-like domain
MQVFGLPGHIIRDALARWRKAMAQGLTSEQAAKAAGFPRSTLYRWRKRAEPLSRRPRRLRQPRRPQGLAEAVERLRLDHPMWGKEKLGPILRKQGYATSEGPVDGSHPAPCCNCSTTGAIIARPGGVRGGCCLANPDIGEFGAGLLSIGAKLISTSTILTPATATVLSIQTGRMSYMLLGVPIFQVGQGRLGIAGASF